MGCGFYGNQSFEGMCSKCYKEFIKRKQQPSPPTGRTSPGSASFTATSDAALAIAASLKIPSNTSVGTLVGTVAEVTPPINIPDVPTAHTPEKTNLTIEDTLSPSTSSSSPLDNGIDSSPGKTKRRNRCYTCRKKVGLTGFECRCGGLFCGLHRYSDKHNCTYDYKADGREQIAKANPVVVGEKVKKI